MKTSDDGNTIYLKKEIKLFQWEGRICFQFFFITVSALTSTLVTFNSGEFDISSLFLYLV